MADAETIALRRAEEQMVAMKSLREHGAKIYCLECRKPISSRRKFGMCAPCAKTWRVRREMATS